MTRLKVAVRVRPLSVRETEAGSVPVINVENGVTVAVTNIKVPEQNAGDSRERVRRFTFDYCFQEDATQEMVFNAIEKRITQSLKKRYHSCVLAYGQSSTGKTHTMLGFPEDPGLTPMLCERVFDYLQESAVCDEMNSLKVTVSYLEIYNEKVKDLLDTNFENITVDQRNPLKVREHPKKGPYVQGLSEHSVFNSNDLLEWLKKGNKRRRVAATLSNPQSSRSHSVFSVNCDGVKLSLIDLAGSERASSKCFNLSRFKEGANINKSLVALGNVISVLADQTFKQTKGLRRKFVPYRDSVLTWLLKDTLGGNSNTFVVATVSPSSACYNETVNTLRFGQRAKLIVSRPVVNEDPKEKTIRELRAEIIRLKDLLKGLQFVPDLFSHPMSNIHESLANEIATSCHDYKKSTVIPKPEENYNVNNGISSKLNADTTAAIEKLVPLIDVSTSVKKNKITQLRRTFSVDHNVLKECIKMYGSNESLPSASTKSTAPSETELSNSKPRYSISSTQSLLRRKSLTKNVPPLSKPLPRPSLDNAKNVEKFVSIENLHLKNVEAKVQSIRKYPVRPRSQIVAAVTSRLYSKTKKREVATDTHDISLYQNEMPKEFTICSNARLKLRDLSKKALRAHRSKNEETQTEGLPVAIVKEKATDVDDLQFKMEAVKDASSMSDVVESKEVAIECNLKVTNEYETIKTNTLLTRGTQYVRNDFEEDDKKTHSISFTKYLRDFQELSNTPIYTNSVNINISNNYIDSKKVPSSSSEDSSIAVNPQNDGLPTPDLISNHNSLEQHNLGINELPLLSKNSLRILNEIVDEVQEDCSSADSLLVYEGQIVNQEIAQTTFSNSVRTEKAVVNLATSYAAEVQAQYDVLNEICIPLSRIQPTTVRCNSIEYTCQEFEECITEKEPLVLKSIVKENSSKPQLFSSSEEDLGFKTDVMDSLEYHLVNKKVKFNEKVSQEKRMVEAMSEFLEEATQLMSKIDRCSSSFFDSNYEIEVTVNDGTKTLGGSSRRKNKTEQQKRVSDKRDSSNQTYLPCRSDISTQCDDSYLIPFNRCEALLEDTCRRLDEKIQLISSTSTRAHCIHEDMLAQEENHSDLDDSSLESNTVAFSDYGSLPRRRHKRYRRPACSPSAFLKQLTNMRRQVIKSSREDLINISNCNE